MMLDGNVAYTITTTASSADMNYSMINPADVSLTNTDNEVGGGGGGGGGGPKMAGIIVTPTSGLSTTEAGGTANFSVVLMGAPTANVTINLSSSNTAEGTVSPISLTFTPSTWNVTQSVTVTGVDELLVDGPKPYTIITAPATSSDTIYNGWDGADVSVTNQDNEVAPLVWIETLDADAAEEGSDIAKFRFHRPNTIGSLQLNYTIDQASTSFDPMATIGDDYSFTPDNLLIGSDPSARFVSFAAGQDYLDVIFTPQNDSKPEAPEKIKLDLSMSGFMPFPTYMVDYTRATASATIKDNDPPKVKITAVPVSVSEGAGTATFRIERSHDTGRLRVYYHVDREPVAGGIPNHPEIVGDGDTVSTATGGPFALNMGIGFNADYDINSLPNNGNDNPFSGWVDFMPGMNQLTVDISVTIFNDVLDEPNEKLRLKLVNAPTYEITTTTDPADPTWPAIAQLTIMDDDTLPTVWVEAWEPTPDPDWEPPTPGLDLNDGDTPTASERPNPGPAANDAAFRIHRRESVVGNLTVDFQLNGTATCQDGVVNFIGDYQLSSTAPLSVSAAGEFLTGSVTIPNGQSYVDIYVLPVDNILVEPKESVSLSLVYDYVNPTYTVETSSATIEILDDDGAPTATNDFYSVRMNETLNINFNDLKTHRLMPWFKLPVENDQWPDRERVKISHAEAWTAVSATLLVATTGAVVSAEELYTTLPPDPEDAYLVGNNGLWFQYTPPTNWTGTTSFEYAITVNGQQSARAMITVTVTDGPVGIHGWRYGISADFNARNADAGLLLMGGGEELAVGLGGPLDWFYDRANGGDVVILSVRSGLGYAQELARIPAAIRPNSITVLSFDYYAHIDPGLPANVQADMTAANAAARAAANSAYVWNVLNDAEGVFITGGDQLAYIEAWKGTQVDTVIQNRLLLNQLVVAGTSAGLHILGQYDYSAPEEERLTSPEALQNANGPKIALSTELLNNIAPLANVITDSHFSARDRMGRLVAFLAKIGSGNPRGLAVNEGAGIALALAPQTDNASDPTQDLGLTTGKARVIGGSAYFLATDESELMATAPVFYRHIRVRRVSDSDGVFVFASTWDKATVFGSQYYLDAAGGYLFSEGMNNNIYSSSSFPSR